ncbi:hypothetical protein GDO81_009850 [Engystomops pustulosus]|uniref:Uncharacterized protein n=1 Tax=Engystomops pustulosus TaxID=76066 RepID=A0AAV7BVV7_ENGPU|nr:hypothetical protein GDO81_009850 [Engystomops pustulosus]
MLKEGIKASLESSCNGLFPLTASKIIMWKHILILLPVTFNYFLGYNTWTGMLQVDLYHTHPIVLTFCHMLTQDTTSRKYHTGPDVLQDCRNKLRRRRWHLAYTLIKNPTLILYRKPTVCHSRSYPLNKDVLHRLLINVLQSPDRKFIFTEQEMETSIDSVQL